MFMNKKLLTLIRGILWASTIILVISALGVVRAYITDGYLISRGYNATITQYGTQLYVVGVISESYAAMPIELNPLSNLTGWLSAQYDTCTRDVFINCTYIHQIGGFPTQTGAWQPLANH